MQGHLFPFWKHETMTWGKTDLKNERRRTCEGKTIKKLEIEPDFSFIFSFTQEILSDTK